MKKALFTIILSALTLTGCGNIYQLNNDVNDSVSQLMGTYSAPTVASHPTPSGCAGSDDRCRQLDQLEERGYLMVRQKQITWTKLVNVKDTTRQA